MRGESSLRGIVWDRGLGWSPSTAARVAVNKSLTPPDVVILEGKAADPAMVSTDVLVVGGDFKFW